VLGLAIDQTANVTDKRHHLLCNEAMAKRDFCPQAEVAGQFEEEGRLK
jgi:hypothetical protein